MTSLECGEWLKERTYFKEFRNVCYYKGNQKSIQEEMWILKRTERRNCGRYTNVGKIYSSKKRGLWNECREERLKRNQKR